MRLVLGVHQGQLPQISVEGQSVVDMENQEDADKQRAIRRQELRRSNAAVPIPSGKYKKPRSTIKQELRDENR